jgi:putative ABC transport system permease protein
MGIIRHKIWYDLWENMGRTLRVVAIIAIGAFAVGTVLGGKEFILKDVNRAWTGSAPATIGLNVKPAVSDETLTALAHLDGIRTVEGWYQDGTVRWRRSPSDPWQPALLVALEDYPEQSLRQVALDDGAWPAYKSMGVQRDRNLGVGDQVELDVGGKVYPVNLNGVLYNVAHPSAFSLPDPMFFTTRSRFTELTGEAGSSLVLADIPAYTDATATIAADLIQHELEKQDVEVTPAISGPGGFKSRIAPPDRFVNQDAINSVFFILTVMAGATLVLGLFLVYNTINAIIIQQVNQIGVMKAVGAKIGHILLIYFSMVLVYAGLALLVTIPLGALGAYGLRRMMLLRLGIEAGPFAISRTAVLVQTAVALLSPLVVALIPVLSGARVTVREAISTYGLSGSANLLDRLLVKFEAIPRLAALTLSNTFRNPKRVLLTQVTLVGAGVIFMMVMNTRATLQHTFGEVLLFIYNANVMLDLEEPGRILSVERLAAENPAVTTVEMWATARGAARPAGQPAANDDEAINLRGVPLPGVTYRPSLRAGRWLTPVDTRAVVLNQELAQELGVQVGDWITIDITGRREADWQVVGLLYEPVDQAAALAPREVLLRDVGQVGLADSLRVQTFPTDAATEVAVAADLRVRLEGQGYTVQASSQDTAHRLSTYRVNQMALLFIILTGMAVMTAIVGAVALSGTLAINVMERTREIGVMRAIGASSGAIAIQFVGEGLILGWLSWLLAIPLSFPAGWFIITTLAQVLRIELIYQVSPFGFGYWLAIITVLAVIASWFPAQKAAQTSVRESLAYV